MRAGGRASIKVSRRAADHPSLLPLLGSKGLPFVGLSFAVGLHVGLYAWLSVVRPWLSGPALPSHARKAGPVSVGSGRSRTHARVLT